MGKINRAENVQTLSAEGIAKEALESITQRIKNLKTMNIIVAGKTGVGKSTLINSVFRDKLAETGIGRPVTDHMRKYTKKDVPLAVYDTRGFELNPDVQRIVKQDILDTINKGLVSKDINEYIHCVWYCINATSNRIEQEEIQWIKELTQESRKTRVPIIIVLTQAYIKKQAMELKTALEKENLDVIQIIPVVAENCEISEEYTAEAYGCDTLVRVMGEALPDELMDTLQNVQIVSLEEKKRWAQSFVEVAVAAAMVEGAVPIPFSDCALLVPTQMTMLTSITVCFGISVTKAFISTFLSVTLGSGGMTILGRKIVAGLAKLIPGAGSVVGGVISAATAGTLTVALGETYIQIMELVFKGEKSIADLETDEGKKQIKSLFRDILSRDRTN